MTEIKRYTKKPITIEAISLQGYGDFIRAAKWVNDAGGSAVVSLNNDHPGDDHMIIQTIEGNMEAHVGWFIIRGIKGEFYPCEPEIFALSYDRADEPVTVAPPAPERSFRPDPAPTTYNPPLSGGEAVLVPV